MQSAAETRYRPFSISAKFCRSVRISAIAPQAVIAAMKEFSKDRYGVDVNTLLSANGLPSADQLSIGQVLRIPQ